MYLAHFQLRENPFRLNTDPRFLWLGENHKKALKVLLYGVRENKGLLLLTGDIGSGKTMLTGALIDRLDKKAVIVGRLSDPGLELREFYSMVAHSFGIKGKVFTRESLIKSIKRILSICYTKNMKALLVIDEAQIMHPSVVEEIRLLTNIEHRHKELLNILLVGQNEANRYLLEPLLRSFSERISTSCRLAPLSETELAAYISHRLKVAGAATEIFTEDALHEIHLFAKGSMRQVNIICDMALVHGFWDGKKIIDRTSVKACQHNVRILPVNVRPLPGETWPAEDIDQRPESLIPQPDAVALLSGTVRRLSLYGTLALLILLPCGYLLYSNWNHAYLTEILARLNHLRPAPSTPLPEQAQESAQVPYPIHIPGGERHDGLLPARLPDEENTSIKVVETVKDEMNTVKQSQRAIQGADRNGNGGLNKRTK
jgi:type II secretory pathway predicted ATPase ExeA